MAKLALLSNVAYEELGVVPHLFFSIDEFYSFNILIKG